MEPEQRRTIGAIHTADELAALRAKHRTAQPEATPPKLPPDWRAWYHGVPSQPATSPQPVNGNGCRDDDDPGPAPPGDLDDGTENCVPGSTISRPRIQANGDRSGWAERDRAHAAAEAEAATVTSYRPAPIDWGTFWAKDRSAEDFLVAPIIARGRSHAIYAGPKTGKSLVQLFLAASAAAGRPALHRPAGDPIHVVYVDLEMTEDDLQERLEEMGFGPDTDLSRLHYYLLPSLPPMDTAEGGRMMLDIAADHQAELVVIDTIGRAVSGDEDKADTIRAFYRHTGLPLKGAGIAVSRLDHSGKDAEKGQRGSSAKNDDVDVVYRLTKMDAGYRLAATHRRMAWIPETTDLVTRQDPLRFETAPKLWPAGVSDLARILDELDVPLDASRRRARELIVAAGRQPGRNTVVGAALAWRKHQHETGLR